MQCILSEVYIYIYIYILSEVYIYIYIQGFGRCPYFRHQVQSNILQSILFISLDHIDHSSYHYCNRSILIMKAKEMHCFST